MLYHCRTTQRHCVAECYVYSWRKTYDCPLLLLWYYRYDHHSYNFALEEESENNNNTWLYTMKKNYVGVHNITNVFVLGIILVTTANWVTELTQLLSHWVTRPFPCLTFQLAWQVLSQPGWMWGKLCTRAYLAFVPNSKQSKLITKGKLRPSVVDYISRKDLLNVNDVSMSTDRWALGAEHWAGVPSREATYFGHLQQQI